MKARPAAVKGWEKALIIGWAFVLSLIVTAGLPAQEADGSSAAATEAEAEVEAEPSPDRRQTTRPTARPAARPAQGLVLGGKAWADIFAYGMGPGLEDAGYAALMSTSLNIINARRNLLIFEAAVDFGLGYGSAALPAQALSQFILASLPAGIGALIPLQSGNELSALSLELKKFSLSLNPGFFSLKLGRQIHNSGRALVFSPADLFSSPDLSGLSATRRGSDIALLSIPIGSRGGGGLIAKPGIDPGLGIYAARLSSGFKDFEAQAQVARGLGPDAFWCASLDFKADILIGLYAEACLYRPDASGIPALRTSLGGDYSWNRELFLRGEYYFNGLGPELSDYQIREDGLAAFQEVHNAYLSLSWLFLEEFSSALSWIGSIDFFQAQRNSGSATIVFSWQAVQNSSLSAFLRLGYGATDIDSLQAGLRMELKF